jgi:hypothetical protein
MRKDDEPGGCGWNVQRTGKSDWRNNDLAGLRANFASTQFRAVFGTASHHQYHWFRQSDMKYPPSGSQNC